MKTLWFAALVIFLTLMPNSVGRVARAATSVDLNAISSKLTQIAGVRENDIVLLTSDATNYPFLEDLAVQVRAAGGFPIINVTSDNLNERLFTEVPAKYDSQPNVAILGLYKMISSQINVDYGGDQNYDFFARADQKRLATQAKASAAATQLFYKLNHKFVEVGNGIFPNPPNARLFHVSQTALANVFWTAMNGDYSKVQANAQAVKAAIAGGSTMRVTNGNGTDISFSTKGVHVIVSDGTIPSDCAGTACVTLLPAGDVIFIPAQGTAHGKMVIDNTFWGKDLIKQYTATFTAGRLVSMTSPSDLTKVKAAYAAGGTGRDAFTYVDIGVNNDVTDIPGSLMLATFAGGSVSLGFGGDVSLNGDNTSAFTFSGTQPGCTVTVDGKAIIKGGKLVGM
jgi:aminopeptidase